MSTFHKLKVQKIIRETQDAISVLFEVPAALKESFSFVAGQYITIKKTLSDKEVRRAYSICASPKSNELKVAIKAVEKGFFSVYATTKLKEGDVFDSSEGRDPLEFQLGSGMVIEGFNDGLVGMKEGESKSIEIPVEKADGPKNEDYIVEIPKDKLDNSQEFEIGMQVSFSNEQQGGQPIPVEVVAVTEETVTFDSNPPLACKDLVFEVEMVGILKG